MAGVLGITVKEGTPRERVRRVRYAVACESRGRYAQRGEQMYLAHWLLLCCPQPYLSFGMLYLYVHSAPLRFSL